MSIYSPKFFFFGGGVVGADLLREVWPPCFPSFPCCRRSKIWKLNTFKILVQFTRWRYSTRPSRRVGQCELAIKTIHTSDSRNGSARPCIVWTALKRMQPRLRYGSWDPKFGLTAWLFAGGHSLVWLVGTVAILHCIRMMPRSRNIPRLPVTSLVAFSRISCSTSRSSECLLSFASNLQDTSLYCSWLTIPLHQIWSLPNTDI